MKNILFIVALLGLVLSLIAHGFAIFGIDILNTVPYLWVLHIGIFVVFFPAIIQVKRRAKLKNTSLFNLGFVKPLDIINVMPKPVVIMSGIFFLYAVMNFAIFVITSEGKVPGVINEKLVIYSADKRKVKEVTPEEYNRLEANIVRGFSGHWMFFYCVSMGIFYPRRGEF